MILKLNGYTVKEVITKPNVRMNFKDFTCTNTPDLQIGDIILVKDKTEPPIVVKDIANTLNCYSIEKNNADYQWYRFPYLVQPKDTEFVYKLKLLKELVLHIYSLKEKVYTGDSFMYFKKSDVNLRFTTYTKTNIEGVYVKTDICNEDQTKKLVILSDYMVTMLSNHNELRFNPYITPDTCDIEWLNEIKNFIEIMLPQSH